MSVRVTLSLDIDPEAWREAYGDEVDVREDVREYVRQSIEVWLADQGLLKR